MRVQIKISVRLLSIPILLLLLAGCSSSRHLEKRQSKVVYESLGLDKTRKDNYALYREASVWLHVPHVEGGTSRRGTDCSFLVYSIYKTVYGKTLERNSSAMLMKNCRKIGKNSLREGDLVFFSTGSKAKAYVNHVGIYLKANKFLHASTSKGVIVSDLNEPYYQRAWACGGRVK
jgi:cell wall-associated NlpC family hydrolase